jgi:acyl-CoA synthetase (NDP forming)
MRRDLSRLLRPASVAVIGGGLWCRAVVAQCRRLGFTGPIWRVHPRDGDVARIEDLPSPPDAAFIGINRHATIEAVAALRSIGAGGATCFASGFSEASAEDAGAATLQDALIEAAGDMPVLGPNCYGLINALDGVALWPDQHGALRVESGVAILTQSSNIAINLTMQARGLPVAYMVTCGNMALVSQAEIAQALLDDPRVSAIGLHIEGFGDLRHWEALAAKARDRGVPLVAMKMGRSVQAQAASLSHTASLAGADAGAQSFLERLGIARLESLPAFLETLKLMHLCGPLPSNRIASISCSGGEAGLMADACVGRELVLPELNARQEAGLREALGPMVALANPLDYHTYIWRDAAAMSAAWSAMADPELGLLMAIVDYPRPDRCDPTDWSCATEAALNVRAETGVNMAVVTTLPELLPEDVAARLMAGGVVPLHGLEEALAAAEAAALRLPEKAAPVVLPGEARAGRLVAEATAKTRLARYGLDVPEGCSGRDPVALVERLNAPLVLKGEGFAHKTEAGAVVLGLMGREDVAEAAAGMGAESFLLEELVTGGVAELIIGITRDPAHGFLLTLGAGGVLTELISETATLLVPATEASIDTALSGLKTDKLLRGWRGAPAADRGAILRAIMALQDYVLAKADLVEELEVNPLICTPSRAVAADILLKEAPHA